MRVEDDEIRDLRAEAEELRLVIGRLRARLLALARVLPFESLDLLEKSPEEIGGLAAGGWDIFEGWEETITLVKSDVETEMRLLWARLAPATAGTADSADSAETAKASETAETVDSLR